MTYKTTTKEPVFLIKDRIMRLRPHVPADKQKQLDNVLHAITTSNTPVVTELDPLAATLDKWEFLYLD